jgi:isopropylmalate/homocitrate/citramalate synthase
MAQVAELIAPTVPGTRNVPTEDVL